MRGVRVSSWAAAPGWGVQRCHVQQQTRWWPGWCPGPTLLTKLPSSFTVPGGPTVKVQVAGRPSLAPHLWLQLNQHLSRQFQAAMHAVDAAIAADEEVPALAPRHPPAHTCCASSRNDTTTAVPTVPLAPHACCVCDNHL